MQQTSGSTTRRMRVLTLALGLTLPGLALVPVAASAHADGDNCVIQVSKTSSAASSAKCFVTFTEAVRYASGGAISNAPANAAEAAKNPAFTNQLSNSNKKSASPSRSAAAPQIIIGIEYDDANYGPGSSLTFFGTATCTGPTTDVDYEVDLPSNWWDRISSFQTFNVCWAKHYYLQAYGGASTSYQPSQTTMPIVGGINFNNNARSIRWS